MDDSLFTIPRYIPEIDSNINEFNKINKEDENEHIINNNLKEKDNVTYNNELYKDSTKESNNLNYDTLEINEKMWFNNLIKKKEEIEITNIEESENDEEIIINTDNIFKNIYPFFKTEEDSNYLNQKKELKKNIKNMS
ncbi:conserved Plasmodium protein, unknown function [Plasmodium gallinaceum]|uniref:Uncharacterized protein n=1 Tax=Plasmodium gallinaceum TaxID=5849 RepID=A0A1J1GN27_PLAGA|nr:conserved Plasmodium protein, unknown function [Plasmodium gallinaceum]CRG93731.1 conserved Plasmodium protein, unknown function [Plasmodium gallinaceum]